MRQPGYIVAYLTLAQLAYPEATVRILTRARRLCANHGPASGALLKMAVEGLWSMLFQRITDQDFANLPEVHWPDAPSPEQVAADEGRLAAFEVCMAEALSTHSFIGKVWATMAVDLAVKMNSPGWVAIGDLVLASHATNRGEIGLAVRHLVRALEIIRLHHFEGLLVYAMLINLPFEANEGVRRAYGQAEQAITQVISLAPIFRDWSGAEDLSGLTRKFSLRQFSMRLNPVNPRWR